MKKEFNLSSKIQDRRYHKPIWNTRFTLDVEHVREFIKKRDKKLIDEISTIREDIKAKDFKIQMYHLIPKITEEFAGKELSK